MSDEKGKVVDFHVRRQAQLQQTDPVMVLADKVTKMLADDAMTSKPAVQLAALELSARALMKTLEHAHGVVGLNSIILEAEELQRRYSFHFGFNKQAETPTVYDDVEIPDTDPSPGTES